MLEDSQQKITTCVWRNRQVVSSVHYYGTSTILTPATGSNRTLKFTAAMLMSAAGLASSQWDRYHECSHAPDFYKLEAPASEFAAALSRSLAGASSL
jgi:hypothetical protein